MTDVVDQPAEVGYSVGTAPMDNDAVTAAFYSWLKQFYTTFPNLRKKNLHIMGESWGIPVVS
jgi:carboxypeptidase C (cathepsin A)